MARVLESMVTQESILTSQTEAEDVKNIKEFLKQFADNHTITLLTRTIELCYCLQICPRLMFIGFL